MSDTPNVMIDASATADAALHFEEALASGNAEAALAAFGQMIANWDGRPADDGTDTAAVLAHRLARLLDMTPACCAAAVRLFERDDARAPVLLNGMVRTLRGRPDMAEEGWGRIEHWLAIALARAAGSEGGRALDLVQALDLVLRLRVWRWREGLDHHALPVRTMAVQCLRNALSVALVSPDVEQQGEAIDRFASQLIELGAIETLAECVAATPVLPPPGIVARLAAQATAAGRNDLAEVWLAAAPATLDTAGEVFDPAAFYAAARAALQAGDVEAAMTALRPLVAPGRYRAGDMRLALLLRDLLTQAPERTGEIIDLVGIGVQTPEKLFGSFVYALRGNPPLQERHWCRAETWLAAVLTSIIANRAGETSDVDQLLDLVSRLHLWRWRGGGNDRATWIMALARQVALDAVVAELTGDGQVDLAAGRMGSLVRHLLEFGGGADLDRLVSSLPAEQELPGWAALIAAVQQAGEAVRAADWILSRDKTSVGAVARAALRRFDPAVASGDIRGVTEDLAAVLPALGAPGMREEVNGALRKWLTRAPEQCSAVLDLLVGLCVAPEEALNGLLYCLRSRPDLRADQWIRVQDWMTKAFAKALAQAPGEAPDMLQMLDLVSRLLVWSKQDAAIAVREGLAAQGAAAAIREIERLLAGSDAAEPATEEIVQRAGLIADIGEASQLFDWLDGFPFALPAALRPVFGDVAGKAGLSWRAIRCPVLQDEEAGAILADPMGTFDRCFDEGDHDGALKAMTVAMASERSPGSITAAMRRLLARAPARLGDLVDIMVGIPGAGPAFLDGLLPALSTDQPVSSERWSAIEGWFVARFGATSSAPFDETGAGTLVARPFAAPLPKGLAVGPLDAPAPRRRRIVFVSSKAFYENSAAVCAYLSQVGEGSIFSDDPLVARLAAKVIGNGKLTPLDACEYDPDLDRDVLYEKAGAIQDRLDEAYRGFQRRVRSDPETLDMDRYKSVFLDEIYVVVSQMEAAQREFAVPCEEFVCIGDLDRLASCLEGLSIRAGAVFLAEPRGFQNGEALAIAAGATSEHPGLAVRRGEGGVDRPGAPARPVYRHDSFTALSTKALPPDRPRPLYKPVCDLDPALHPENVVLVYAESYSRPYAEALTILLENRDPAQHFIFISPYRSGGDNEKFNLAVQALAAREAGTNDRSAPRAGQLGNIEFLFMDFQGDARFMDAQAVLAAHAGALAFIEQHMIEALAARYPMLFVRHAARQLRFLMERALLRIIYATDVARGILDALGERISAVVTFTGRAPENRVAALEARARRIPVVDWQLLLLGRSRVFLPIVADRVLAISKLAQELYVDYLGIPRAACRIIGFPRFVRSMRDYSPDQARTVLAAHGIDPAGIFHVFAAQPLSLDQQRVVLQTLADAARIEQAKVLICAHPSQRETGETAFIEAFLKEIGTPWLVYSDDFYVQSLFPLARSTISYSSNVLFETASIGFSAILIDPLEIPHVLDYRSSDDIAWARNAEELAARMRSADRRAPDIGQIDFAAFERDLCAKIFRGMLDRVPEKDSAGSEVSGASAERPAVSDAVRERAD